MQRKIHPFARNSDVLIHPPPYAPLPSLPVPSTASFTRESTSSTDAKISPTLLLVIGIVSIIFFVCGLLHLLVRFFVKRPSIYSLSLSTRYSENSGSDALQRQLQQLFRLHDSGLDQEVINALPVFCYKEIVGLKDPFDCAVCLCEFADEDQLRLLPVCSHAFHINCIDTWLLSNSTCPLCRNALLCAGQQSCLENQFLGLDVSRESSNGQVNDGGNVHAIQEKPVIMEEPIAGERTVYSVRLGKFRSSNLTNYEETSSRNLDARRCYSMGSCEYVICDSDLLVSLSDMKPFVDANVEANRISCSSKGESFSVSKIWQWSKKGRFTSSLQGLPLTNKVEAVEVSV